MPFDEKLQFLCTDCSWWVPLPAMRNFYRVCAVLSGTLLLTNLSAADLVKRRVLILDFENVSKNANYEYLKESLADNLRTELIKTNKFDLMDQRTFDTLMPKTATAKLSVEAASKLALEVNCEAVVIGKFITAGNTIRINAEAIDALAAKTVAAEKADGSLSSEVFKTIDAVVSPLAAGMASRLSDVDLAQIKRRKDTEEKLTGGDKKAGPSEPFVTMHFLGMYSIPVPKINNYISGGFGGKFDIALRLHKYIYPYIHSGLFYSKGKGTVTSMTFFSAEGGLTYPIEITRWFVVSPFVTGGINYGRLLKTENFWFLLASFSGGFNADFYLTKNIALTLNSSFTYVHDKTLAMPYVLVAAGVALRF